MASPDAEELHAAMSVAFNPKAAEFIPGQTWGKTCAGSSDSAHADTEFAGRQPSPPPGLGAPGDGRRPVFPPGLGDVADDGAEDAVDSAAAETPLSLRHFLSSGLLFDSAERSWRSSGEVNLSDEPAKVKVRGECACSDTSAGSQWSASTDSLFSSGLEMTAPPMGMSGHHLDDLADIECKLAVPAQIPNALGAPGAGGPGEATCRWHKSAKTVGVVSEDGHVFTKTSSGRQKVCMGSRGRPIELAPLCMVFDESLRCGGTHRFNYQILDGELGAADGAGFVFDSKVRRNNIQRMRSIFLNQRGCVCIRDHERVKKLGVRLPPLGAGMSLGLQIDLDSLYMQFIVFAVDGHPIGSAEVSVGGFFGSGVGMPRSCSAEACGMDGTEWQPGSGFFCAVVTKEVSVGLV
mmetsp:Transcript_9893/g.28128  ORF Transcript_9893/g.28128 Transcript_9893/m.28128 type:complete len:406 (+) Transcript_9893:77-1294(+)